MANPFANESTAIRVGPVESVQKSNLSSALALESKRNQIRKELNDSNLTNEEVDRIIYLRENPEMPPSIGPAITHRDAYGRPLSQKQIKQRNKEHQEEVQETVNRNNGLRTFGYSNLSDKQAEQNPELVSQLEKDAAADITAKGLAMAAFIPGMQWLRGASAPLYYGVNAGLTGASAYDWYKNGPNFWNVTGTIGGGFDLLLPTALKGYQNYQLGKALNQGINDIQTVKLPYNVGWGPRQTVSVTRVQHTTDPILSFYPERWDVVNEGANPLGVWFQGRLGFPRTIQTGASSDKALKAAKARNTFATRPVQLKGELTLEKPLVTVGEVPNRSTLSYQAEQLGSDGIIYNGVYDNGYNNNQVILAFNPESFNNTSRRLGILTNAEKLGISKGIRNNKNLNWQRAIENVKNLEGWYTGVPHHQVRGSQLFMDENFPNFRGTVWGTKNPDYARGFSEMWLPNGQGGKVFKWYIDPNELNIAEGPKLPYVSNELYMPLHFKNGKLQFNPEYSTTKHNDIFDVDEYASNGRLNFDKSTTDNLVRQSENLGYDAIKFYNVNDGYLIKPDLQTEYFAPIDELILNPGAPRYLSMWDYILKKRPSVSNKTYSINSSEAYPYLTNGQWDMPRIKEDLLAGRQDFIDWIESSAYKAAAEANKKEAEAMGLKYVPTYEYPAYQKFKDHGIQTVFVIEPSNNAQGWVGTQAGSPITINLAKAKNIRSVNAHESAHVARHAWLDPEYPLLDVKKQQAFLRYKNSQVFKDDADLSQEAGNRFYDFSSTGFPHEAVTNSRDLGKFYGIKVGQEYPGPEKTLELLNRMEQEAKPGFQKKFVQSFRRDPEHLEFVWKALNGTQWALIPTIVGTNYIMNNEKD